MASSIRVYTIRTEETCTSVRTLYTGQFCYRCDRTTDEPVVVNVIHAASGPGHTVYACPKHAPRAAAVVPPAARLDVAVRNGPHGRRS
ncbi:hypothetical protein [Streptomyces sp. NPDC002851]